MDTLFRKMCLEYNLKGTYAGYRVIKNGNINDTYLITTLVEGSERNYIFQRINLNIFKQPKELVENAENVSDYIYNKLVKSHTSDIDRMTVRFYRNSQGDTCYYDHTGGCWRVISYVFNARTYDIADNNILRSTGIAFGRFQRLLEGFPAEKLNISIPDFHNTAKRYDDLEKAAKADPCGRLKNVADAYEYLMSMKEPYACLLCEMQASGKLPVRVTHNDTKCNNVMFDKLTGAPLAVIDLDTVMPGLMGHDFGDAVRFAANTAAEDESDLSLVSLDLEKFKCFAEGFIGEVRDIITDAELDTLAESVLVLTLELAARFLADYLLGDVYFKVKKDEHNKVRAYSQIALSKDVYAKLSQMKQIVNEIVAKMD